jgi:AcrR family transcriptional regulator
VTPDAILTPGRILEAAEGVIRRYGPAKATVVDVARALGVSHGSVYRHFPSKAALREAVSARWLARIGEPLEELAHAGGPARERMRRWFDRLIATKRGRALEDPELFAAYVGLAAEAREVVAAHVEELTGQLECIVADGVARGEFHVADARTAARAAFDATSRYHHPAHAGEWADPQIDAAFEGVWQLVVRGLEARP